MTSLVYASRVKLITNDAKQEKDSAEVSDLLHVAVAVGATLLCSRSRFAVYVNIILKYRSHG